MIDLETEKTVLGSILLRPIALAEAAAVLDPADMQHPAHREIYQSMLELDAERIGVEHGTVLARCGDSLRSVGGGGYLGDLVSGVVTVGNLDFFVRRLAARGKRARMTAAFAALAAQGRGLEDRDEDFLLAAQAEMASLDRQRADRGGPLELGRLISEFEDSATLAEKSTEPLAGIPFGVPALDGLVSLRAGNLAVVGGRPGSGKTSLLAQMAASGARSGAGWLIFSLEMSRQEVTEKILAVEGVSPAALRAGKGKAEDWSRFAQARSWLAGDRRIWIDDGGAAGALTMADIRARARRWRMVEGRDLERFAIGIDYFQLIRTPVTRREGRRELLEEASREAKALAKSLGCPIVMLSALNRESEKSERRPLPSDLRECGQLEADSDTVIFTHRPELTCQDDAERDGLAGKAELIVSKHRHGRTGILRARFDGPTGRFLPADGGAK